MGVYTSNGVYGLPDGLMFSLPCTCEGDGEWRVVSNLVVRLAPALGAVFALLPALSNCFEFLRTRSQCEALLVFDVFAWRCTR